MRRYTKWAWWLSIFLILLLSVMSSSSADFQRRNVDAVEKAPSPGQDFDFDQLSNEIVWAQTISWNNTVLWNETVRKNEEAQKIQQQRKTIPKSSTAVTDGDFWRRLANCENPAGDAPGGYFQFMGTTREKVGWAPGQSYETQRAEAIWWAEQIHPREGTSAGWPHCWWVAQNGS